VPLDAAAEVATDTLGLGRRVSGDPDRLLRGEAVVPASDVPVEQDDLVVALVEVEQDPRVSETNAETVDRSVLGLGHGRNLSEVAGATLYDDSDRIVTTKESPRRSEGKGRVNHGRSGTLQ